MLLRRARARVTEIVQELRSAVDVMREHIDVIRTWTEELRRQREQLEREALARKPFDNNLFEWDEHMRQSPGSYVQHIEWLQRVRDWGRDQDYTWDRERARFVRQPTPEDVAKAEADGRSLTYSMSEDGDHLVDCSNEVAEAYVREHPGDPMPEPGVWSST